MGDEMIASIKEFWLIVECPHCQRPQVKNRFVSRNTVIIKPIDIICEMCDTMFTIDLKVMKHESLDTG
jgi:hypothetical protein